MFEYSSFIFKGLALKEKANKNEIKRTNSNKLTLS